MSALSPPPTLSLSLLGEVTLRQNGHPLTGLPSRKAEALLIYLVYTGRPAARETLAELLWDDRPHELALSNLRTLLAGVRRVLGPVLVVERDTIRFDPATPIWLDVADFERALTSRAPADWQRASDLYRGDFLAGFHLRQSRGFEEWAIAARERLRRLAVAGLEQLAQHALDTGDYGPGLEAATRLVQHDPLSEAAYQQAMRLLARLGRRTEALATYETCRRLLADELDVSPTEQTMALYAHIRSAETLGSHNLPPITTGFVGRAAELQALTTALAHPTTRLLTLLGPGGIGKTRLALKVARQIAAERPGMFLHGLCWVPLDALPSPHLLAAAIAEALGEPGPTPPTDWLRDFLREREVLLLLDNFEHLLGDDPAGPNLVAALLAAAPMLKILVTSRERLDLHEEQLFDVSGLSVPPADQPTVAPGQFDAVDLFLAGARRVRRDFEPDATEATAIARTCRLLGGAPLGVELAAAATRQRACSEIATALARSLDSLSTTLRNVPERHRSLRAAFEHSWELLPPAAQFHFARLAIFPEAFAAAAAAAVAAVDQTALSDLADRSLLELQPASRFLIHPTLRQYAAEKLAARPALQPALGQQHAAYYLDLVASQGNGESPSQRAAIEAELPNVRAAWRWAAAQPDPAALGRTVPVLHSFYTLQSWFDEGIEAFQLAGDQLSPLAATDPTVAQVLCELLMRRARLQINVGRLAEAQPALEQARTLLPHVVDPDRHATLLGYLAITAYYAGDYAQATALADESRRLAEQTGKPEALAFALNFLGSCAKAQGDYDQARTYFEQAVTAYRALDDAIGAGMVLNNLGNLAQAAGDFAAAEEHYRACTALFTAHNYLHGAATALANTGRLATRQGRHAEAEQLLTASLTLKQQINDQRGVAIAQLSLAEVALTVGAFAAARAHLAEALPLAERLADVKTVLDGLVTAAALAAALDQTALAARLTAFALDHKASARETHDRAQALAATLGGLPATAATGARRWQR